MYGGYYGYGYYFDPTYFLVLIGLVLCLGASALVNSTMRKYSKVRNMRGITGAEAARNLLNREGLYNVDCHIIIITEPQSPQSVWLPMSADMRSSMPTAMHL